jgi:hypothetical protein
VQTFSLAVDESMGSQPIPTKPDGTYQQTVALRHGRTMRLRNLVARQRQQSDLQGDPD